VSRSDLALGLVTLRFGSIQALESFVFPNQSVSQKVCLFVVSSISYHCILGLCLDESAPA